MPKLDADLLYLLRVNNLTPKYRDRWPQLKREDPDMLVKDCKVAAARQILDEGNVDLEKAMTPAGHPVVRKAKSFLVSLSGVQGQELQRGGRDQVGDRNAMYQAGRCEGQQRTVERRVQPVDLVTQNAFGGAGANADVRASCPASSR